MGKLLAAVGAGSRHNYTSPTVAFPLGRPSWATRCLCLGLLSALALSSWYGALGPVWCCLAHDLLVAIILEMFLHKVGIITSFRVHILCV